MIDPPDAVWLHRKNGPPWPFYPSVSFLELAHTTRYGNTYLLLADHKHTKPFWVGRAVEQDGRWYVVTVESEIGARYIEFPMGGRYWFPGETP